MQELPPRISIDKCDKLVMGDIICYDETLYIDYKKVKIPVNRSVVAQIQLPLGEFADASILPVEVLKSEGYEALEAGSIHVLDRYKLHKQEVFRLLWSDESAREACLD